MAIQVCLMSHCCDYQHGALAQLEAPQVNHRGEASICTAGGPQTTLMGFHLLLGHWTFWKAPAHDALGLSEGASTVVWLKLDTLGTQVLCLFWHVVHHVFHSEPEFPICSHLGCLDLCVLLFFLTHGYMLCLSVHMWFSRVTQSMQISSTDALVLRQLCSVLPPSYVTLLGGIINQNLSHLL